MVFSSLPERCLELDDLPGGNPFGIIGTGECGQLPIMRVNLLNVSSLSFSNFHTSRISVKLTGLSAGTVSACQTHLPPFSGGGYLARRAPPHGAGGW
jgi:hypothetical protein